MAADKALIAGAAKVAGAKGKVDYATTKAFTDLGEDILENSQKVQADMEEAQNELNDLYDEDQSEIRTNAITLDTDVATSMFGTPDVVGVVEAPSTAATAELDRVGGRSFDYYDESKKGDISDKRKEAQIMVSITNGELGKMNESKKIINDGFEKSQFTEIKNESYIIYSQHLKGTTKWVKGEETGKSDRYGYELEDGTFVTRSDMDKHREYYFQKDNSAEFANFLEASTKRRFKTATTNEKAEIIFNDEKKTLNSDINNLEKFVINRMGPNTTKDGLKGQFTKKGVFDKVGYEKLLKDYGDTFLREQQALHYTPPKAPEVEEEDEPEGDTPYFTAQKDMLDKINSSNKLGENTYRLGKSPAISYYQSTEFEEMLPPALKIAKSEGVVQIQDVTNTNVNHIINPEQSLEYNLSKLIPLLRSKKRN